MQQTIEAETRTTERSLTSPALTYNLPTTLCGDLTVKKDSRTVIEKQTDANQKAYEKANETYQPVSSQLLTFQVVGVMSIVSNGGTAYNTIPSFVNGLLGVNYFNGAFIPNQLYSQIPTTKQHKDILQNYNGRSVNYNDQAFIDAGVGNTIIAFPSIQQAQDFINTDTCYTLDTGNCNKLWTSQIYGANYLLVGDFGKLVTSIAKIALPIALALAAIIIWITMARVIIDSRRETAVFRALGAKRGDVMQIYISYSLIVALLIAAFALVLGSIGAIVIEVLYGAQVTNYAKVAYGVFDQLQPFSFIGINLNLLGLIVAAILIISFLAVLPPLIRNIRRNPIRDMRDDN
jgi:ABC-type antimicrobial peptide transport system permease subunit